MCYVSDASCVTLVMRHTGAPLSRTHGDSFLAHSSPSFTVSHAITIHQLSPISTIYRHQLTRHSSTLTVITGQHQLSSHTTNYHQSSPSITNLPPEQQATLGNCRGGRRASACQQQFNTITARRAGPVGLEPDNGRTTVTAHMRRHEHERRPSRPDHFPPPAICRTMLH